METLANEILEELNKEYKVIVQYHDHVTDDGKIIKNVPYQLLPSYNEPLLNFNTLHYLEKIFRYMHQHDIQEMDYTEQIR